MRLLLLATLVIASSLAHAQRQGEGLWLNVDYTYTQFSYKEQNATIKGAMPGIRGDLGVGLLANFGITVGGEYRDGNLKYDGATFTATSAQVVTSDYMADTYAMANFMFGAVSFSAGVGKREWLNGINGYYRRRLITDYYPASITLLRGGFYVKGEMFMVKSGHSKVYMRVVSTSENDVDLAQSSGNGYGAELGLLFPNMFHAYNRVFIGYKRWDISASEAKSDGVRNVQVEKYSLEILQAGLGFSF